MHATIARMRSIRRRRHVVVAIGACSASWELRIRRVRPSSAKGAWVSTPAYKGVTQGCLPRGQLHLIAPDGSGHGITEVPGCVSPARGVADSTRLTAGVEILDRCLDHVYVIDVDTRNYHEVPCGFECFGGAWTANGSRLLVTPSGILGTTINNSIYSIAPDGSDLRLLVAAPPARGWATRQRRRTAGTSRTRGRAAPRWMAPTAA